MYVCIWVCYGDELIGLHLILTGSFCPVKLFLHWAPQYSSSTTIKMDEGGGQSQRTILSWDHMHEAVLFTLDASFSCKRIRPDYRKKEKIYVCNLICCEKSHTDEQYLNTHESESQDWRFPSCTNLSGPTEGLVCVLRSNNVDFQHILYWLPLSLYGLFV